jgi:hypothetical protein
VPAQFNVQRFRLLADRPAPPARLRRVAALTALAAGLTAAACSGGPPAAGPQTSAVYDKKSGRLSELVSDKNGDGKPDTWAHMDGARITGIDLDRDGDGKPDRWEHYAPPSDHPTDADMANVIVSAEESDPSGQVVRHEFYEAGVISRVEEDTDVDGRVDKWEFYDRGQLAKVELDLSGRGKPDQRLVYGPNGALDHVEKDAKGDGHFERVRDDGDGRAGGEDPAPAPGRKGGR